VQGAGIAGPLSFRPSFKGFARSTDRHPVAIAETVVPARRAFPLARAGVVPALITLALVSSLLHVAAGWLRATPVYFSDEYMYAELGRSLAESGLPLVRGELAPFPALVYPLLTAPGWLLGDVELSYRVIQFFGAVAMSLACVPVFLLARRLGLRSGVALALAAFTVAVPDMVYAGWLLAETVAYPLALVAVAAAASALARPTRRNQLLFVALAAAATGTRAQFAVLFFVYPLAVALQGLAERRFRATVRDQALTLGLLVAAFAVMAVLGPSRLLGMYRDVLGADVSPLLLAERMGSNALVLAYASAWLLLPGAALGFGLALARPTSRLERAFAAFAVPLVIALLVEASLFATPDHVQERYAFYSLPLLALAFGLYASRGWPLRLVHAALAAVLLCVAALAPLTPYTAGDGKTHSALLLAVGRLEALVGDSAGAALLAAALAGILLLIAIASSFRPPLGTPLVLVLALAFAGAGAAGATSFDLRNADLLRAAQLPPDPSWVDHAADGDVTMLRTPGGVRTEALEQLFWNPSVDRVALLPHAPQLDAFHADEAAVARDGTILIGGRPADEPLLVETRQSWVELSAARRVAATDGYALWEPAGRPRLSLLLAGRYSDGWLAPGGDVTVWPARADDRVEGRLTLQLSAPDAVREMTFTFRSAGRPPVQAAVPGGETSVLVLTVCSRAPWQATFAADQAGLVGSRLVSGRSSAPAFTPDATACAAPASRPPGTRL
jgi:hypothetical protein